MAIARPQSRSPKGYILLSVMLLMTLMLVALSVELPRISQQIKRDKEEELIHRAQEYTRAIKKFYRKFGRYPLSIEQLENTNNMRFLRKRFKDPMTGKDDWRIIHVGEAILKVPGSGGTANINGPQGGGNFGTPIGGTNSSFGSGSTQSGGTGQNSQNPPGTSTGNNSNSTTTSGSTGSAFANPQGGGPMIGIASSKKAVSIKIINEKDHYDEWQFVYDPNVERQQQLGGNMGVPNINGGSTVGTGSFNTNLSPSPTPTPPPP